jgi:hypothetical protein
MPLPISAAGCPSIVIQGRDNPWPLSPQTLQRISTGLSLISLVLGFWVFGMLIFINRHQAELNGLSSGSSVAMVGGIGAQPIQIGAGRRT